MELSPVSWPWWGFVPQQNPLGCCGAVSLLIPSLCLLHSLCHPKCHKAGRPRGHRALPCPGLSVELGKQHQHCSYRIQSWGTEPRPTGRRGMCIAGSSPGMGDGFLDSNTRNAGLGWELWRSPRSLPLEMAPGGLCLLVQPRSGPGAHGACPPCSVWDRSPRLALLLEPLLALPQELTWLLCSPLLLIWSHQGGTEPWPGVLAVWPWCQQHGAHPGGQNLELLALWWLQSARAAQPITIWCPI